MRKRAPIRNPIRAYQRDEVAARRFPEGAHCACGESRHRALIPGSNPVICAACDREENGQKTLDDHHAGGEANSPATIPVPVNDHRARLNVDQYEWPKGTLENPTRSPLLAAAGRIRGFVDVLHFLIDKLLLGIPELLEDSDAFLAEKLGPKWWIGTPVEKYAPKR